MKYIITETKLQEIIKLISEEEDEYIPQMEDEELNDIIKDVKETIITHSDKTMESIKDMKEYDLLLELEDLIDNFKGDRKEKIKLKLLLKDFEHILFGEH